jgi:hypothetical protein
VNGRKKTCGARGHRDRRWDAEPSTSTLSSALVTSARSTITVESHNTRDRRGHEEDPVAERATDRDLEEAAIGRDEARVELLIDAARVVDRVETQLVRAAVRRGSDSPGTPG